MLKIEPNHRGEMIWTDLRSVKHLRPQWFRLVSETPPGPGRLRGCRSSSWTFFWIPLWLMCFTCVSLASPPCGCSVWRLIARSCVLTFLSDRHLRVMSLPVWRKTCLVPVWLQMLDDELFSLSSWQQTTRFNVSWRIRQHRNTLEEETTVGGRQSAEAGNNKHGCFHEPSSEFWRLFLKIRAATFGGHG